MDQAELLGRKQIINPGECQFAGVFSMGLTPSQITTVDVSLLKRVTGWFRDHGVDFILTELISGLQLNSVRIHDHLSDPAAAIVKDDVPVL